MKSKKKIEVFPIVNGLIFIILSLLIIIPMWKVLVDSFDLKTAYGMKLWPEEFGLAGYISVFKNPTLSHPLMISVITTIAGTIIALILSTFGAYVLIQWDMPGRNLFANLLLFTMIFQGGMIPTYLVLKSLHLTNTIWVVILFPALNVYNLVLMRNFFEGIPASLFESATLDADIYPYRTSNVKSSIGIYRSYVCRYILERLYSLQTLHYRFKPLQLPDEVKKYHHG